MSDHSKGLYCKFDVSRMDNRDRPGHKHHGCEYFVLDLTHDKHAAPALLAYATSCQEEYPALAADLFAKALEMRVLGIAPALSPLLKEAIKNVATIGQEAASAHDSAEEMATAIKIFASAKSVTCPHCDSPQDGFMSDPRGGTYICDDCNEQYFVAVDSIVEID